MNLKQIYSTREFKKHCTLPLWHVKKRSFLGPEFTELHLAAGLHPDPLGELTALPQTPSCTKGGKGGRWEWKRGGKERNHRKQREKRDEGKGGKLGIMEYVSRIVSVRYWQSYRFATLKISWPPLVSPLKKAGAATALVASSLDNLWQ